MIQRFQKNSGRFINNQKGMTLIEIMIVLAILASIIALMSNKFLGAQDKAKTREAKIMMGEISKALTMYNTDCGKFPSTLESLMKADPECKNWGPTPYWEKKSAPKDPWGHDFVYESSGTEFTLKSLGKDGAEGGEGFNADIELEE